MSEKLDKKLKRAQKINLERLLKEERTGLQALATAFLEESSDPDALMERLELMASNAIKTNKSERVRDVLVYGLEIYRRAYARYALKPVPLFDPEQEQEAEELASPPEAVRGMTDPSEDHRAISQRDENIRSKILSLYQFHGSLSDPQLHELYTQSYGPENKYHIWRQRKELTRIGVVTNQGATDKSRPNDWQWNLTERHPKFREEEKNESERTAVKPKT
jgi:hypothetical protein